MRSDLVVVGAGAAGLFAALTAAREGARVTLVSARPLAETASYWAQGGAAAALAVDDSPGAAPRGHARSPAAASPAAPRPRSLTDEAAGARDATCIELGVQFDADRHGDLALGLEGGHSRRRIIHAGGSATGRRILRGALGRVGRGPRIEVLEGRRAAAILQHGGVRLEDGRDLTARATILATGGAAALYSRTTNPPGSFGSGLLLARAGGRDARRPRVHPVPPDGGRRPPGPRGLPDLRGRPRRGRDPARHNGERFVNELDPRDAVARAIFNTLQRTGAKSVGLDMTMVDPGRFPNIVAALQEAGLDPTTQRVPVAPASHYVMGGIVTDLDGRATGVERLYAVGECACTGLHGANRLASNSLSECFVFGRRAALKGLDEAAARRARAVRRRPDRGADARDPQGRLGARRPGAQRARTSRRSRATRTRSPGWSPSPRSRATRRAARTPAPSSPSSTRRSTRSHTILDPGTRHPALRAMALLIDWGGVLTTSMLGSFDAFARREGVGRAARPSARTRRRATRWSSSRPAAIDIATFERRLGAGARRRPARPREAAHAGRAPDHEMLDAVRALPRPGRPDRARRATRGARRTTTSTTCSTSIVLSGAIGIRKPDPRIYRHAAERLGHPAERCVFVDDLGGNLKPAKALGMTTIRHTDASSTIAQLERLLSPSGPS